MKNLNKFYLTLAATAMVGFTSCDSDDDKVNAGGNSNSGGAKQYFNVVVGISVETSNTETYAGAFGDISSQDMGIVYENWGFLVPSVRTAYVYTSTAGDYMYSLSYGGGTISKHRVLGGQYYDEVGKLDVSLAMGTNNPRWTKINDDYASLHNVVTTAATDAGFVQANARLTAIDLPNFEIITTYAPEGGVTVEFPVTEEDKEKNLHVWRIDAPSVSNGRAYYGINKRIYDVETASNVSTTDYQSSTLVVDFPSFTNAKIITSEIGTGSTQGYRTPVSHTVENGDIYQISMSPTYFLKISGDDYDNSYRFSLSEALGMNVGANGWFYVGDGIGYIPFYDIDRGIGSDVAAWGVARVDLNKKTAVKLALPENLWLQQYQMGTLGNDGKFYMALAPLGGDGHIYMFDPSSESATAFEKGASIQTVDATSAYLGVF